MTVYRHVLVGAFLAAVAADSAWAQQPVTNEMKYADPHLQMPPSGKLSDDMIADFETWIRLTDVFGNVVKGILV
jgi:hypothetical protein